MDFSYAKNGTCSCGKNAAFEIADGKNTMLFCTNCLRAIAAAFFGISDLVKATTGEEAKTKPDTLFKDLGDISFDNKDGERITTDPFVCNDYTPAIYFRNSKKYVHFDWDSLLAIAVNLGALEK